VNLHENIEVLLHDTLDVSIPLFAPELILCATIVLMLLIRVFNLRWLLVAGPPVSAFWIALAGSVVAFLTTVPTIGTEVARSEMFTGLLVYDGMTVFFRAVLLLFAWLFVIFTRFSGVVDREGTADFYCLVLGSTLGMCIMVSANHMLMVFLGVEMASVPSYVLAGMLKRCRKSSEAALKYAIYGAGAAGVMLYGISLLAGVLGSVHLPTMATQLSQIMADGALGDRHMVLVLGMLMVMVGLAFKLSAVPFHFWCPDVFEGATAEVNAFLSVASKAAALALLIRVSVGLVNVPSDEPSALVANAVAPTGLHEEQGELNPGDDAPGYTASPLRGLDRESANADAIDPHTIESDTFAPDSQFHLASSAVLQPPASSLQPTSPSDPMRPARMYLAALIGLLAAITCTFGNLAAYGQTNIKRLLAYSTIAHAGIMMMPVAAAVTVIGTPDGTDLAEKSLAAVAFYVAVYLFMNFGAFAIVAILRNAIGSEEIADYAGLINRCPGTVICLSLILLSLLGLPPLAGFPAKLYVFASLAQMMDQPLLFVLLVIAAMNTVLSLFYYLRVVKTMALDPEPVDRRPVDMFRVFQGGVFMTALTVPVVLLGVFFGPLHEWALAAAKDLIS